MKRNKYLLLGIGIILGIAYGFAARYILGEEEILASISFLFLVPILLGMIPLMFADPDKLTSYRNLIFIPWLTVISFFLTLWLVGLEDFLCLFILAAPFLLLGTLGAFVYQLVQINKRKKSQHLIPILVLPFLLAPVEQLIYSPSRTYEVSNEILIPASPAWVWEHIVEVKPISEEEYDAGFFNWAGIPRPLRAEVDRKALGGHRTGFFDEGLRFEETITVYQLHEKIAFEIAVNPESIRQRVFDQHVLKGNYFSFVEAEYTLKPSGENQTLLRLSSRYQLTSKINFYGRWWGNWILGDFQERLLQVIAHRCE